MAKGDWFFKFDCRKWRSDAELRKCSLETRGFWIDCLAAMKDLGTAELTGTVEQIARAVGCFPEEAGRAIAELGATKTADVTRRNKTVTIKSRRLEKEAKSREDTRRRVEKHRRGKSVTPEYEPDLVNKEVTSNEVTRSDTGVSERGERPGHAGRVTAAAAFGKPRNLHHPEAHPAVMAVRAITGKQPEPAVYLRIINAVGGDPDHRRLAECYSEWVARGFKPQNIAWVTDWYAGEIPQAKRQGNGNGTAKRSNLERLRDQYEFVSRLPTEAELAGGDAGEAEIDAERAE